MSIHFETSKPGHYYFACRDRTYWVVELGEKCKAIEKDEKDIILQEMEFEHDDFAYAQVQKWIDAYQGQKKLKAHYSPDELV